VSRPIADRILEHSNTLGTGNLTLLGAQTGYRTFADAFALSEPFYYVIEFGSQWEIGSGYLVNLTTLARDTVLESTNSNNLVSFPGGSKRVFCTAPASYLIPDKSYSHEQSSASASWTITHNLGKYPSVTVVDSSGREVMGEVTHNSTNQITIGFSAAFSGYAYMN